MRLVILIQACVALHFILFSEGEALLDWAYNPLSDFLKVQIKSACQLLPLLFKNGPIRVAQIACRQTVTTSCLDNSCRGGKRGQID